MMLSLLLLLQLLLSQYSTQNEEANAGNDTHLSLIKTLKIQTLYPPLTVLMLKTKSISH